MSDLLHLGTTGLFAYRRALDITGENIANAGVEGYHRRSAVLTDATPLGAGFPLVRQFAVGGGARLDNVERSYNAFLISDARVAGGQTARTEVRQRWLDTLQSGLNSDSQSVGASIARFYTSAQDIAADPTSLAARTAFLEQASTTADRVRSLATSLAEMQQDIQAEAKHAASRINQLAASLARVNEVQHRTAAGTAQSAALMDERDRLLAELAGLVKIHVTTKADGTVDVSLNHKNGPSLVAFNKTDLVALDLQSGQVRLSIGAFGQAVPVTPDAGATAGLLDASRMIMQQQSALDTLANNFASTINAAHQQGVDLDGAAGGLLFETTAVFAEASRANRGSSSIQLSLQPGATPSPAGYTVTYDGATSSWMLQRSDATASVSGTGTLVLDGMQISVAGQPMNGDRYTLTTTQGAAGLRLVQHDARKVAAAAPWTANALATNQGNGLISVVADGTASALPALPGYRILFTSSTHYDVVDPATSTVLASGTYSANAPVAGAGFSFRLSGAPQAGDGFSITPTPANQSNNENILRLIQTRDGTAAPEKQYLTMVTQVATALAATKSLHDINTSMQLQAENAAAAASDVNLDEEAAALVEFQQAYQASSRVIAVAREIFNSILEIT
jgi:flagellar hook-associated protein 1 FlgK